MLGAFRLHRGVGPVIINMSRISVDLFFMSWIYVFLTLAWTFGLVHMRNNKSWTKELNATDAGKSLSEALIFASTKPQYDDRLFIELQVQYVKIPSSNLGRTCCVQKLLLTFRTIFVHNMFSPCSEKRRASDKDLPVQQKEAK